MLAEVEVAVMIPSAGVLAGGVILLVLKLKQEPRRLDRATFWWLFVALGLWGIAIGLA